MRFLIAAIAACVLLCAQVQAAPKYLQDFGPVAVPQTAEKTIGTGESGWYIRHDGSYNVDQLSILVDAVGTFPTCTHRLTVMVVVQGVGYTRGFGVQGGEIELPLLLELYQPPLLAARGNIEIASLGPTASIGVNRPATPDWQRAAGYTGSTCEPPIVVAPTEPHLARLCRQYRPLFCGG